MASSYLDGFQSGSGGTWLVTGNAFPTNGLFGTLDNSRVDIITNNLVRGRFETNGTFNWLENVILGLDNTKRLTINSQLTGGTPLVLQGAVDDNFYTNINTVNPTAIQNFTFTDRSGEIAMVREFTQNLVVGVNTVVHNLKLLTPTKLHIEIYDGLNLQVIPVSNYQADEFDLTCTDAITGAVIRLVI